MIGYSQVTKHGFRVQNWRLYRPYDLSYSLIYFRAQLNIKQFTSENIPRNQLVIWKKKKHVCSKVKAKKTKIISSSTTMIILDRTNAGMLIFIGYSNLVFGVKTIIEEQKW